MVQWVVDSCQVVGWTDDWISDGLTVESLDGWLDGWIDGYLKNRWMIKWIDDFMVV